MGRNAIIALRYFALLPLVAMLPNYDDQFDLASLAPYRPVPKELDEIFNVTKTNVGHCMQEFRECLSVHTSEPFCAINLEQEMKSFAGLCEMMYDNCVHEKEDWRYFRDEECLPRP